MDKLEKFRNDLEDDIDNFDDESSQTPGSKAKVHFTSLEIQVLGQLIFDRKDIVECSETSGYGPEAIRSTWELITGQFADHMKLALQNPVPRTEKQLRSLWSNLKAAARKIDSKKRNIDMRTGNKLKLKLSPRQETAYNVVCMVLPELDFTLVNPFDSTSAYEQVETENDQFECPDTNDNYVQMKASTSSRTPLKINTSDNSPEKSQSASSTFKGKGPAIRNLVAMPHVKKMIQAEKSGTAGVPNASTRRTSTPQENINPDPAQPTNKKPRSQSSGSVPPNMDDSKFDDLKRYQDEMYRGKISVLKKEDRYWDIKCKSAELEQATQKLEMVAAEKKLKYYAAKCREDLGLNEEDDLSDADEN